MNFDNKIGVTTVLYNSSRHLEGFVQSLIINKDSVGMVIFVDNGWSDKHEIILKKLDNIVDYFILKNRKNIGYAGAINQGIKKLLNGGYNYILVTNNDLKIKNGGLGILLEDVINNRADVVGVPTTNNGMDYRTSCFYDEKSDSFISDKEASALKLKEMITASPVAETAFVQGGIILFNKSFFEKIGLYDDYLFFGGDELDFSMRIQRAKLNIKCLISLRSFEYIDHFTTHDGRFKFLKAKMITQGEMYVMMKHGYGIFSLKFYQKIGSLYSELSKGSILRFFVLGALFVRAFFVNTAYLYLRFSKK